MNQDDNIHGSNDWQQPDPGSLLDLEEREPEPQPAPQSNEQDLEVLAQDNANVPQLSMSSNWYNNSLHASVMLP